MSLRKLVGILAVLGVAATILGSFGALAGSNALLSDSPWQTATLVTLAATVVAVAVFSLLGGSGARSMSTPYW